MIDVVKDARRAGVDSLTEVEAKDLLDDVGIPTPESILVEDVEGALEAAEAIGYPVVVKVHGRDVTHKSDWGGGVGVQLGVMDERKLQEAYERIATADAFDDDTAVLIERAVETNDGVEVLASAIRHDAFGPVIVFGLGGVYTEVLDDVTYRLAPLSITEARQMTRDIRGDELLDGFRSKPAVDRDALATLLSRLSTLLVEHPTIRGIELNPVLTTADRSLALDAIVQLESGRGET